MSNEHHVKKSGSSLSIAHCPLFIDHCALLIGSENCLTDVTETTAFSTDHSAFACCPAIVLRPTAVRQIPELLKLCRDWQIPVTVRAAGTGTTGGAVPLKNGALLDLSQIPPDIKMDPAGRLAWVSPTVLNESLKSIAATFGLYYPPDPASQKISTLGGNVAENAGGLHCVKYGVTRDFVAGLEFVTMSGDCIQTGVLTATDDEIDLTPLLISSEGTLGVITRLALRLIPLPKANALTLAGFTTIDAAAQTVSRIIAAQMQPAALELLDTNSLAALQAHNKEQAAWLPPNLNALLLIEIDGDTAAEIAHQQRQIRQILDHTAPVYQRQAVEPDECRILWDLRRALSPALKTLAPTKINEDVVVPRRHIPALLIEIARIATEFNVLIANFGHAGDGNIHVNVMTNAANPQDYARAGQAVDAIFKNVIALDGAISGEHGIGLAKKKWLPLQLTPAQIALQKRIKSAFDPADLLNPDKIFGQWAMGNEQ